MDVDVNFSAKISFVKGLFKLIYLIIKLYSYEDITNISDIDCGFGYLFVEYCIFNMGYVVFRKHEAKRRAH